jgi:uncharacterized protein YgiB involved in biofilm formation
MIISFFFFVSREFYKKRKRSTWAYRKYTKKKPKQEGEGREEKHPKNPKTWGNPKTTTKLAHKTQRLKHRIRGPLALPRLEPKLLTS